MASVCVTPIFKVFSALLIYPTEELVAVLPEITAAISADRVIGTPERRDLDTLLIELGTHDLYELQERYVDLFDKTRKLSLHLFEHVHGESRDRGQAMVDLAMLYEKGGLLPTPNELPDYLPLFLEYLATRPLAEARALLSDTGHILAALEERLAKRDAPYAAIFTALLSIAGVRRVDSETVAPEKEADDLAALDAAWEETAVTFGPGENMDGCSVERLHKQLRAAKRSARTANT
ncbi:MAG: nitrate reductase molybdenum cofactor assembly chaperone [Methylovirgula sp.]